MTHRTTFGRRVGGLAACLMLIGAAPAGVERYTRVEGLNLNSFVRQGAVSAHIVLRSGPMPRLIVAFPAGNSGVGLWLDANNHSVQWTIPAPAEPVTLADPKGRSLHGVRFIARTSARRLDIKQAVLSSIRVLRDYQALGTAPSEVLTAPDYQGNTVTWARDRLDGAPGYRLSIAVTDGHLDRGAITAGVDGHIGLAVTALTGETPLTPVAIGDLLNDKAAADPAARRALAFLSYREKFLAGSWRFDTYFGRDTLMSVRLLMPALKPQAVETGLRSVLERLSPAGEVAHEEDIGEFAILDHLKADGSRSAAPTYNYNMIDGNVMLAPVARAWLLDDPRGRARAAAFLGESDHGARLGDALMRNLRFVIDAARPFAADPRFTNLLHLKQGMEAGEWRDSNTGLGGGRYPYDVNAVFVPAALRAALDLYRSHLLDPYLTPADRSDFATLPAMAATWMKSAPPLFAATVPPATARGDVTAYAAKAGVPAAPALAAIGERPVEYDAIALDAGGRQVPIENSDVGFALLFGEPQPAELETMAATIARPFPTGLMTGAGMLVANPVFAPPAMQGAFGSGAYHGTVIWSWQQALAAAGLARQLARAGLPDETRHRLAVAQDCLWNAIDATKAYQASELWSWRYAGGAYHVVAFGAGAKDADESNAAQLWSTVFLALHRPAESAADRCPTR